MRSYQRDVQRRPRRSEPDGAVLVGTWYQDSFERRRDVLTILGVVVLVAALGLAALWPRVDGTITRAELEARGVAWPFTVDELAVECAGAGPVYSLRERVAPVTFTAPADVADLPLLQDDTTPVRSWAAIQRRAQELCRA